MEPDFNGLTAKEVDTPSSTNGPQQPSRHDAKLVAASEGKETVGRTKSLTNGQSSSAESSSRPLPSGEKLRRKRKLHRCLSELKHFLISTDRYSTNDTSESDRVRASNATTNVDERMTGVDAVRRALKLLKRHQELAEVMKRDSAEETAEKRATSTVEPPNATDILQYSVAASSSARWCWSSESTAATAADKCDDIVQDHEGSMRFVVSCNEGTLLKVSENAYGVLQLPPGTPVIGQRFINLFSPNDQLLLVAFMLNANLALSPSPFASNQVPKSAPDSLSSEENDSLSAPKATVGFYASLRRGSLKQSRKEEPKYVHCRVVCNVTRNIELENSENEDESVLLSVAALPLSVLIGPEYPEPSTLTAFYTRHSPSCIFTHIDAECVKSLGYLPRELVGRSLLSYVSKDSLKWLEAAHEQAVKAKGKPVRSNLYYFVLRDGKLATMKSEWSLFVNPWSRETEFVIGYHKVIDRSKEARFYSEEDAQGPFLASTKLEGRAAKAQSRIRRALAKVKDQRYYKSQTINKKPVTACSSTTDKENGSTGGSGVGIDTQNGSTGAGQSSNLLSTSAYSSTKAKRVLNMGVFLDRMIENELFRNAALRCDAEIIGGPLENCKLGAAGDPHGEGEHAVETSVIHHQTSPISTGENISSSPPESSGSGPTYKEINLKEKVARFLDSQAAGQSSSSPPDGSNSGKSQLSGYSPPSYHQDVHADHATQRVATTTEVTGEDKSADRPPDPSLDAIDLTTVVAAASIMHRSRSAAADLTQYRHLTAALEGDTWNVLLTPEILRQFTKEKERESKADWKRRFSTADAPSPLPQNLNQHQPPADKSAGQQQQRPCEQISPSGKRAPFDQPLEICNEAPPQKILRSAAEQFYFQRETRPSSMPVISRMPNSTGNLEAGSKNPSGSSPWTCPAPARNTTDYYRSLGPTPAPPPGKNFQISSAPLPSPAPPTSVLDPFGSASIDKNAFSCLGQPPSTYAHPHQSAFAPPPPKSAFGSEQSADSHRSVIRASPTAPFAAPPPPPPAPAAGHWLNIPGASASAILQRMVPKALAREQAEAAASSGFWPPAPPPSSCSDPSANLDAYGREYQGSTQAPATRDKRPYFDYSVPQGPNSMTSYPLENVYNDFSTNPEARTQQKPSDQISSIRESLMLLEENC